MNNRQLVIIGLLLTALILVRCTNTDLNPALDSIDAEGLKTHIAVLASDDFQGRKPLTEGEDKTIRYLEDAFRQIGCLPGNGESYLQDVPVMETITDPGAKLIFTGRNRWMRLNFGDDFVAASARPKEKIRIRMSDVVFVGYGIVAPEYGWDVLSSSMRPMRRDTPGMC